jgi:hypothetical protein
MGSVVAVWSHPAESRKRTPLTCDDKKMISMLFNPNRA